MILRAILEGLIWPVMWIIFVYVIIRFFPWEMVHDYPKDIQDKTTLPEPTDRQKRNAIDLILMDWIVVCSITPSWMVLPGTEDCEGYKDYLFHFKGFLVGCVYSVIMALVFSGIIYGILRLMGVH